MYTEKNSISVAELPEEYRPRELLLSRGAANLSDEQLLQILIGSGSRGRGVHVLAREVLDLFDRYNGDIGPERLKAVPGLGEAKSALLCAALEFVRRRLRPDNTRISHPSDVIPVVSHYADRQQEHFLSVSLNGAHEVIRTRVVSIGLVNRTLIHPREMYAGPMSDRAAAVIAVHNHPSGNVEPSSEDRQITTRLCQAGELLGIPLLDHIVFSRTGYYSFREEGEL